MCEYVEHGSEHLCSRGADRAPTPTEHGDLGCPGNGILGGGVCMQRQGDTGGQHGVNGLILGGCI